MAETTDRAKGKNLICFGAPGTGKSHSMTKQMESIYKANGVPNPTNLLELPEAVGIRTTFHPDSDYSTFVGCYKPRTTAEHQIEYHFQPQAFVNAYVNAWCTNAPYFLVIEEINRGNCAQIFGDLFQVLDRKPDGEHEYSIKPDADLRDCIKEEFKNKKIPEDCVIPRDIQEGKILYLPKNLTLLATMNTSDQSLFPMDSAFKRRWEWCYMPITAGKKARKIGKIKDTFYSWWEFIQKVNDRIYKVTKSEDKKIGYWFVKVNDARETISADLFVNKVLFYLWSDVFKDYGEATGSPFAYKNGEKTKFVTYQQLFNGDGTLNTDVISDLLGENGLELTKLSEGDECKDDPYEKDNEEKQSEETSNKEESSKDNTNETGETKNIDGIKEEYVELDTEIEKLCDLEPEEFRNQFDSKYKPDDYSGCVFNLTFINQRNDKDQALRISNNKNLRNLLLFVMKQLSVDELKGIVINKTPLIARGTKDELTKKYEKKVISQSLAIEPLDGNLEGYCRLFRGETPNTVTALNSILQNIKDKENLFVISDPIPKKK